MIRRLIPAVVAVVLPLSFLPASATPRAPLPAPPAGAISPGITFLANIPELRTAISIDFIGTTMFASTVTGIYAYDVSDPAAPKPVGAFPQYIWENEDVQVDAKRKLLFLSRDPRGFTTPTTGGVFPYGAVQVIDVSIPSAMVQLSVTPLPSGHTTTCVDDCRYTWTAGPGKGVTQPADWGGRPVFALDMRDPLRPVPCPKPIDDRRNDGKTDYTHDVQVDRQGIAWVSGSGGVRGYWVTGTHRNAQTGKLQKATGCEPVPYGGGGTELGHLSNGAVMHNSLRPSWAPDVLLVTEEHITSSCATSGRFVTYSLKDSYGGAGFRSTKDKPYRMKALDTWTTEDQPGGKGCASAHYFSDRGDGLTANAFYGQGTRFLDVRNPRDIRQVGYYRPDDANTWAAYWRPGGYVFVADFDRGVDVLKVGGLKRPVVAPPLRSQSLPNLPSAQFGWLCQVPSSVAAARPELAQKPSLRS